MAKDQKVTLTFGLTDGSQENVEFTVPGGRDGDNGLTTLARTQTLLQFDLNQPNAAQPNACGRLGSGMYVRMRDYIPDVTHTGIIVEYNLLDIPLYGNNSACYSLDYTPPLVEENTGKIYCDVQLTAFYTMTYNRAIGSITNKRIYRPAGTSGTGSLIPTSTNASDLACLRFWRTVMK